MVIFTEKSLKTIFMVIFIFVFSLENVMGNEIKHQDIHIEDIFEKENVLLHEKTPDDKDNQSQENIEYVMNLEKIQKLCLSKNDCKRIINYLKFSKPNRTFSKDFKDVLKTVLKDGLFIYTSVLTGSYLLKWFSDDKNISLELLSGGCMIASYVILKLVEKYFFCSKNEEEVIKNLIDRVREMNDIIDENDLVVKLG